MDTQIEGPAYVYDDGTSRLSYVDDWCYSATRYIGRYVEWESAREAIKADIRQAPAERNGLPIYTVSDHGNVGRTRAIRLRKGIPA